MDPDEARYLFDQGSTVITIDLPIGSEFGIDCSNPWRTFDNDVAGIKMIPPGLHLLFWNCNDEKQKRQGPRTSMLINMKPGEILFWKWIPSEERVEPITLPQNEDTPESKKNIDHRLVPYPYDTYRRWMSLSSYVDENLAKRLMPACGYVSSVPNLISERSNTSDRLGRPICKGLPNMEPYPGTFINWSLIEEKARPPEFCKAEDITKHCLDRSWQLNELFEKYPQDEILGEFQATYVFLLVGHVYEALDKWRALIVFLCSCREAIVNYPNFYDKFLMAIYWQLKDLPDEMRQDAFNGILSSTISPMLADIAECGHTNLSEKANKLLHSLKTRFGINWVSEPDEWAPTIVS